MEAEAGTPEGDRLDVLVTLVEAWERKHFPMDLPDPVEALDARPVLARAHVDGRAVEVGYRNAGDAVCSPDRAETVLLVADEVRVWRGV